MLFNTFSFTFMFLPLVFLASLTLKRLSNKNFYLCFLVTASLFFYSIFHPIYIFLILSSIIFNYLSARLLIDIKANLNRKAFFIFIITTNLLFLIYYKYFNFIVYNINSIFTFNFENETVVLPLAISFFTFQQIAFITSIYKHEIKEFSFIKYFLFISFFPQLIAGPIIKFKEFYPQISSSIKITTSKGFMIVGLYIFSLGMFKKIVISSYLASTADPIYYNFNNALPVNFLDSWFALLAFSLQIYYDFSGYTDMAIGLALCFGIRLPINFYSPYKAKSIKDFWSRWHITLSRFLKEHLYIPLGGNKKGKYKSLYNVLITMLLGGIWHGASWNFVLWGLYSGTLVCLERILSNYNFLRLLVFNNKIRTFYVFLFISLGWVLFRCDDIYSATLMIKTLFFINNSFETKFFDIISIIAIILIMLITFILPNSCEIQKKLEKRIFLNKTSYKFVLFLVFIFLVFCFILSSPTQNISREFIYFQF